MRLTAWLCAGALALAATAPACAANSAAGKVYKWVDKQGVVHYGDQVPPEYSTRQREILDGQGMVVDVLPAEKTPAEILAEKRQQAAAAAQKRRQRQDQLLLDTYSSIADIQSARDSSLKAIAAQIQVTENVITAVEQDIAKLKDQAAQAQHHGQPVPAALANKIAAATKNLAANRRFLADKKADKAAIDQQFAADIVRFKTLKQADKS